MAHPFTYRYSHNSTMQSILPQFADVIVPLNLPGTYTYRVPPELTGLGIGQRVLVPFGSRKTYTAIVVMLHNVEPKGYEVKSVLCALDESPIVRNPQLRFWQWISDYYLATIGDVYKAALPSGLKVESETFVSVNPEYEAAPGELSEREQTVLTYASQRDRMQLSEIAKATGYKNVETVVMRLLEREAVHVADHVVDNYRPRTEVCISLQAQRGDDQALHGLFDQVHRAKKQEEMLLAYLELSHWMNRGEELREVTREALFERSGASSAVLRAAIEKGIFSIYKREINRFASAGLVTHQLPTLTDDQKAAYREICYCMGEKPVTLLHGVTGSGKTSIYMHLIDLTLKAGKQAMYLVPEIALTTQLTHRLHRVFGDQLLIYHSKFSDNERVDIWKRLLKSKEPCVVIGARSAVFLPYSHLGLVIVDEEHESSYKQQDPAPRYNGRDAAIVLAGMHGARTLLGSATPSVETYYKACSGKYGLVSLDKRYQHVELPAVKVIDTKQKRKQKEMQGLFSTELVQDCHKAIDKQNGQVILFQNRRGYSPMVRCKECGWVPRCNNCDVSLTYHKHVRALTCHYCGFTLTEPTVCPACGLPGVEICGYGTERIEDDVAQALPAKKILRMDLDTTRSRNGYERIIEEFSSRQASVLVGTQMVTKGLDFDGVRLVGILNADTMISFPDFRSGERAFCMLEQVSGRAGRKGEQGLVVLQTSDPKNPVIEFVKNHDYKGFYEHELAERKRFAYPPFTRLVNIYMKHRDDAMVTNFSVQFGQKLREVFSTRVLGPEAPIVKRVQNLYIRQIMLKMELEASMPKVKEILRTLYVRMLESDSRWKSVIVYYDVDPV